MVKVKSLDQIRKNYRASISRVGSAYADGIDRTTEWQSRAIAGEANYNAAMQAALSNESRAKGVAKVSNDQWRSKAKSKGATRIGPGMREGVDKQARNFSPYREALTGLNLPPRGPRDGGNVARVQAVVDAMIAKRREIKGA